MMNVPDSACLIRPDPSDASTIATSMSYMPGVKSESSATNNNVDGFAAVNDDPFAVAAAESKSNNGVALPRPILTRTTSPDAKTTLSPSASVTVIKNRAVRFR